jgi:hypothetical protein
LNTTLKADYVSGAARNTGWVFGVATLDNYLFVAVCGSCRVEIYDRDIPEFKRRLFVPGLLQANDIASCTVFNCVYIADCNNTVYRFDNDNFNIKDWSVSAIFSGMSVTPAGNVVFAMSNTATLKEFSTHGELLREIKLNLPDMLTPMHAIQQTNGQIIVSTGKKNDLETFVCLVDQDGSIAKVSLAGLVKNPSKLAVEEDGFIFVQDGDRVILLDPNLKFVRVLLSKEQQPYIQDVKFMSWDAEYDRLYIAHRSSVSVFDLNAL